LFSNKTRSYYCGSYEEAQSWVKTLKDAVGYQSFSDNYEIKDKIEAGKFGEVFLGVHKKTKQYVAIKTIKKESMTPKDIELVKSEIDIMKMCKHPNIVRLLDHFENSQFTFIVMEYLSGGTLANYLEHTPVDDLSERDTAKIAYQISSALEYLHQFGIVHRDLKPENIMINGKLPHESLESLKLMDFGLSKILGPNEKVSDGYGTLTYVAPEVLTRKPYNSQVDIWSLGVIVYYTLSGSFPYDDQSNDESVIAKKVVFQELQFYHKSWASRSSAVKDFILKTMTKDLDKRVKIKDVIKHKWFSESGII
jgi:serine/threonine protein kinase